MSPRLKAVVIIGGGYVLTMVATGVVCAVLMLAMSPHGCAALGRALLVLWGAMALAACLSVPAVAFLVWRLPLGTLARLGLGASFAIAVLGTFVAVAFGLMVAFNC